MKIAICLIVAGFATTSAVSFAEAANCDASRTKFTWRRCMSKEIDNLADAIDRKALDLCSSKITAKGPAAVDERLTCRVQKLTETLEAMK